MRNISVAALAKLTQQYGGEPINIVEIDWTGSGNRLSYSDRDIGSGIKGSILDVSGLDEIIQVSGGGQSQQISLTFDDTDGSIKQLIDTNDPHLKSCWVYQWFDGLDLTDKFLIFRGVLNTPIEWNEGDRSFKFDVISKIEDVEVGFSMEEGIFPDAQDDLIGVPWPLCFGTVINNPSLKATAIHEGILGQGTGIRDFTLEKRIQIAGDPGDLIQTSTYGGNIADPPPTNAVLTPNKLSCPSNFVGFKLGQSGGQQILRAEYQIDGSCVKNVCEIRETLALQLVEQIAAEINPVRIYGGSDFDQNVPLTLNIGGGIFQGSFNGDIFTITGRLHPKNDGAGGIILTDTQNIIESACAGTDEEVDQADSRENPGALASKKSFDLYNSIKEAGFFWAAPGSKVVLAGEDEVIYIANLLPSTILRVAAYRELSGIRQLLTVPTAYYTIRQTDYTGYSGVMEIVFPKALSTLDQDTGGGWSDDIYVTLTSSVGPNTVDILTWFITTYTSYSVDATSFNAVNTLIDNYPMHFCLRDRKNLIQVLEELAFQARCAIWLKDNTFYIKYLSLEPDADDALDLDDIEANSLTLTHTSTEDLVTKYDAIWQEDMAKEKPNKIILRHNVKKYGTHEQEYQFYAYNIHELVLKSASYWLVKKANTWRRLTFKTPIHKLNIEVFDTIEIDVPTLSPLPIKCVVEKATYNSQDNTIDFEVWTPLKSGTTTPYLFAWPADIEETDLFPTIEDQELGLVGSGTEPNFSTIAPKGHPLAPILIGLYQGAELKCKGKVTDINGNCRADQGKKKPSDRGDTKPDPRVPEDTGGAGGAGPKDTPDNCCAEALALAQQALSQAKQALIEAQRAQEAANAGDNDNDESASDKLKKLPKNCGECGFVVNVSWFPTVEITAGGPQQVCVPSGSPRTESFCYGDEASAVAAVEAFNASGNCTGIPPCGKCVGASLALNGSPCEGKEGQILAWSGATDNGSGDPVDGSILD